MDPPLRILLTGAAGFLGSHLAEALLARGDEVLGLDNFDPYYDVARKERNVAGSRPGPAGSSCAATFETEGSCAT